LDGKNVVFGQVADKDSWDLVKKIEACGSLDGEPKKKVQVSGCGICL
jgi:cyclophilin family peptidyl-prolyl cis-trans isomerase